jgi:hypothetical protein
MKTCTQKKNVLVDVRLECEPPNHLFRYRSNLTAEKKEQILKDWVSEFQSFIRDHRSADPVGLFVEQVRKDICSNCESEWETTEDDGGKICANCGAIVQETVLK